MNLSHFDEQDPKAIVRSQRKQLLNQFNNKCVYCGNTSKHLTVDHVIPIVYGGSERISNKVIACADCNLSKGHKPWIKWYRSQAFYCFDTENFIKAWVSPEMDESA